MQSDWKRIAQFVYRGGLFAPLTPKSEAEDDLLKAFADSQALRTCPVCGHDSVHGLTGCEYDWGGDPRRPVCGCTGAPEGCWHCGSIEHRSIDCPNTKGGDLDTAREQDQEDDGEVE